VACLSALCANQIDQIASLAGIGLGVLLGSLKISLPIQGGPSTFSTSSLSLWGIAFNQWSGSV
jgi:hypothetical protein